MPSLGFSTCNLCMGSYTIFNMKKLNCGHKLCKKCYTTIKSKNLTFGDELLINTFKCSRCMTLMNFIDEEIYDYIKEHDSPGTHRSCGSCGKFFSQIGSCNDRYNKFCAKCSPTLETKECPGCGVMYERIEGCDSIMCKNEHCGIRFCWGCCTVIPKGALDWSCVRRTSTNKKCESKCDAHRYISRCPECNMQNRKPSDGNDKLSCHNCNTIYCWGCNDRLYKDIGIWRCVRRCSYGMEYELTECKCTSYEKIANYVSIEL